MFISGGNKLFKNNGDISNLENIDYYKRYIIIELPDNLSMKSEITIINTSSTTGRSFLGIFSKNERIQNTILYHASGNVINYIPQLITKEIKNCINFDSMILLQDYSYGTHNYNLSKQRFNELQTTSSYNDMYDEIHNDNMISELLPFPTYYNFEHHMLNEEINNSSIPYGNMLFNNKIFVKLRDLIDDHTYIYITRNSNYNKISKKIDESKYDISFDDLSKMIIGPVTNLGVSLMINELDFCYDSDIYPKISRIRYKTDHKEPNDLYNKQIHGNLLTQFENEMEYARDVSNCSFRLFVHFMIGNLKLRFIKYDKYLGNVHYDFNYDIGNCRNKENENTIQYINTILF